jgi:hypothetical protein
MTWNYALAACITVLAFSVFNGYTVPTVISGIALAALIKLGAFKIVSRMKSK